LSRALRLKRSSSGAKSTRDDSAADLLLVAVAVVFAALDRRSQMKISVVKLAFPLLAVLATGCASMDTGSGPTDSSADSVNFSLKNSDAVSGSMNAALPDDKPVGGQFF